MSIQITFDEKRDEAKEYLSKAIECLKVCLDENTWGHSDIKETYIYDMIDLQADLMKAKMKL